LAAIRTACLDDLLAESSGGAPARRAPGRPRGSATSKSTTTAAPASAPPPKKVKVGPIKRRSPEDIAKTLAQVI
jgi:hypothetical protein